MAIIRAAIARTLLVGITIGCASWSTDNCGSGTSSELSLPTGATCRIEIDSVMTISEEASGIPLALDLRVAHDSHGQLYVSATRDHRIVILTPQGKLAAFVGRSGRGPGEFQEPLAVFVDPADTLFVFDATNDISVFAPDHHFVRRFHSPGFDVAFLPNGTLAHYSEDDGVVVADRSGNVLRVLGIGRTSSAGDLSQDSGRFVLTSDSGRIWTVTAKQYLLAEIDSSGSVRQRAARTALWFKNPESILLAKETDSTPPMVFRPRVHDIGRDSSGLLWITTWIGTKSVTPNMPRTLLGEDNGFVDAVVDLIDPHGPRLLASRRFRGLVMGTKGDLFLVPSIDTLAPSVCLYRMRLRRD